MGDLFFTALTYISGWYGDFIEKVIVPRYKKLNKDGNVNLFNLNVVLPFFNFLIELLVRLDMYILTQTIIKITGTAVLTDKDGNVLKTTDQAKIRMIVEASIWGSDDDEE